MEFQRIRGRLDRGVEAGQISSEQADQRFAEMKELIHLKDRVAQEIHLEMEEEMVNGTQRCPDVITFWIQTSFLFNHDKTILN